MQTFAPNRSRTTSRSAFADAGRTAAAMGGALALVLATLGASRAQDVRIAKTDAQIDALDPGIKLFVREKMAEGNTRFGDDNIVLFLHGATAPSTCDFDLPYKDYSWADWMVRRGYVVYMGDYRNYGYSTREAAMDEPPAKNQPVTRSYLALRDVEAMVNHVKAKRGVKKVTLVGWSWGAMMAGYYASLHSENVQKLVLYAPLYNFNDHTNLGPGSALQNKRKPHEFNFALGAYRLASEAANTGRWNGEIPLENKDEYREAAVPVEFWKECMATDPTSGTRNPPSLRAPNGVLEDSFYQATGRQLWHAANIYAPTLVVAGAYDTWSFPEDRDGLMRDLVHAPAKRSVLIPDATHFVLFEKHRMQFFDEILKFLKQ
jgi:pimeloyl-ACP methyl ester carboxylesterase